MSETIQGAIPVNEIAGEFEAKEWEDRPHPNCTCGRCKIAITSGPPWMYMETINCGGTAAAAGERGSYFLLEIS